MGPSWFRALIGIWVLPPMLAHSLYKILGRRASPARAPVVEYFSLVGVGLVWEGLLLSLAVLCQSFSLLWGVNLAAALVTLAGFRRPPGVSPSSVWRNLALFSLAQAALLIALFWVNFPFGNMDAYSMWLLKARFLYQGGDHWNGFFSPAFTNSDYPFLFPAIVAYGWLVTGKIKLGVVCMLEIAFLWALAAEVFRGVTSRSTAPTGYLAVTFLCSNVYLLYRASSLYADLPLAFLFTCACRDLLGAQGRSDHAARWVGLWAGLAVLTKQEGLVFAALAIGFLFLRSSRSLRAAGTSLLAMAPLLTLHVLVQATYRQSSPVLTPHGGDVLRLLTDPARYAEIARSCAGILGNLKWWGVLGVMVVALLPRVVRSRDPFLQCAAGLAVVQAVAMTGYFLITPVDLSEHLHTAHERLLLQVWPALVMLTAATFREKAESQGAEGEL